MLGTLLHGASLRYCRVSIGNFCADFSFSPVRLLLSCLPSLSRILPAAHYSTAHKLASSPSSPWQHPWPRHCPPSRQLFVPSPWKQKPGPVSSLMAQSLRSPRLHSRLPIRALLHLLVFLRCHLSPLLSFCTIPPSSSVYTRLFSANGPQTCTVSPGLPQL